MVSSESKLAIDGLKPDQTALDGGQLDNQPMTSRSTFQNHFICMFF